MSRVYLYGFVPEDAGLPRDGLLGVEDCLVELVDGPGFKAVASSLPAGRLEDDQLERRAADLEWMAQLGLRHEQVVAWFVDHAWILPSRLLTLFSGQETLREAVDRDAARIKEALERLREVRQWDLKVHYQPERLESNLGEVSESIAELDRQIQEAKPGKQFLLRRKRQDLARVECRAAARRLAEDLLDELSTSARATRRITLPTDDAPVVLNAALLVPRSDEAELMETAESRQARLEDLGLSVELSGPWAPYRFLENSDE